VVEELQKLKQKLRGVDDFLGDASGDVQNLEADVKDILESNKLNKLGQASELID
jgi:archaellum component FlaC